MRLIVLGSGTCVPSVERNAPGYYLEIAGCHILIDCGSGTVRQLERAGKSYKDIDEVYITHTHIDHVADLLPLLHALMRTPRYRREKDLEIAGPRGIKKYYKQFIRPIIGKPESFSIEVREIDGGLDREHFRVVAARTVHSANSMAYRFSSGDKSVVITGDCDYDRGLIELSRDADLLVIDCSFPNALKAPRHLSAHECGLVAKRAGAKKILLSHIYPFDFPDEVRLDECRAVFEGDVALAEDLMEIVL